MSKHPDPSSDLRKIKKVKAIHAIFDHGVVSADQERGEEICEVEQTDCEGPKSNTILAMVQ